MQASLRSRNVYNGSFADGSWSSSLPYEFFYPLVPEWINWEKLFLHEGFLRNRGDEQWSTLFGSLKDGARTYRSDVSFFCNLEKCSLIQLFMFRDTAQSAV